MQHIINSEMIFKNHKVNKCLFLSFLLLFTGIIMFGCSYGNTNSIISLPLILFGGISSAVIIHKLKERKIALKINCVVLFFICLEVLIACFCPPSLTFLINQTHTHTGGGTYFLKVVIMLIPYILTIKVVLLKYFSKKNIRGKIDS